MLPLLLLAFSLSALHGVQASVTVYGQIPLGQTSTSSAADAAVTTAAAYNDTVLAAPAVPNPAPSTSFTLELQALNSSVTGLSIPQTCAFWGFSIEMSVVTQVLGKNSSFIQVPFLNLMANLAQRAGCVRVRTGGNTQEFASFADDIPDSNGAVVGKTSEDTQNPTETPTLLYNIDYFYLLSNISSLVNVGWFLGIPMNDTTNLRLEIAEYGQSILGDNLLGLQVGNEPDLYADHGHRDASYGPYDYFGEFGVVVDAIAANAEIPVKNMLIAPSVATGDWTPEDVWNTGFIPSYTNSLSALAVEHYPDDNCFALYGIGSPKDLQSEFSVFLNHSAGQSIVSPYINSSTIALQAGMPFYMFETNTASCGGFAGISDSFGATLWALDYGLQMAYSNFTGALLHVGGQNVFYNPFTPPPTNQSTFHQWTIGAVYYSALVIAEVFGSSNTSQIIDLNGNDGSVFTPQYAVYENGNLAKVALFNYITDSSGASDYTATLTVSGGTVPSQVSVKYLLSESVSTKDNITWAGQTFGTAFQVDGRLQGTENVQTVNCDTTNNNCQVTVPAPGFALVFFSNDALSEVNPSTELTFSTTAYTQTANTVTIASSVLATSNGHSGKDREEIGSTSKGSASGALSLRAGVGLWVTAVLAVGWGSWFVLMPLLR